MKRFREEGEADFPQSRGHRMTGSPNKKPRYTIDSSATPIRYTTPLQHIPEPVLPYRHHRPGSGSYHSAPRIVHPSPTPGYGAGFSFEPEIKAGRFHRKPQPSVSPVPFRLSSDFGLSGQSHEVVQVGSDARVGGTVDFFGTPRRIPNLPVNQPRLDRPVYTQHYSTRPTTPLRSGLNGFTPSPYHQQKSGHEPLPFSLPYRRNQSYTDFGSRAPAMAFQPSMPVIAEESEYGEESAAQLYSEPRTITPSPIWDQVGRTESFCLGVPREPYLRRAETPIRTQLASADHQHDPWLARSNAAMISSQSTASRDENRAPSEASVASLPIYAPKASLGIDIEALELAARSPSLDEFKKEPSAIISHAAPAMIAPIYPTSQGPKVSDDTTRKGLRSGLSFIEPDKVGPARQLKYKYACW